MTNRLPGFERGLPMTLLQAREAVMKKFIPTLREHGLTPQQWRVIRALQNDNGLVISTLAERCHLLMPSLSRIINHLEKENLVERQAVNSDHRLSKIVLTERGLALFEQVAPASAERYDDIEEKFGVRKLELLYELLDDLIKSIDEKESPQ